MDSRVEILSEELQPLPQDQPLDTRYYIDRIRDLYRELNDENDRITLLQIRKTFLDLCERQIQAQSGDIDLFKSARTAEDRLICITEAMDGELIDPTRLSYVVEREIAAGRMTESGDFRDLASAGAEVLGDSGRIKRERKSWLAHLFS